MAAPFYRFPDRFTLSLCSATFDGRFGDLPESSNGFSPANKTYQAADFGSDTFTLIPSGRLKVYFIAQLRQICHQNSIVWQIFWQLLQIKVIGWAPFENACLGKPIKILATWTDGGAKILRKNYPKQNIHSFDALQLSAFW